MTDFLGRLAARAVSTPTLRPRTPFRFEPLPPEEPVVEATPPPRPRDRIVERDRDRDRIITREVPVTTVITEPGETRVITREIEAKSHVLPPSQPSPPRTGEKVPQADEGAAREARHEQPAPERPLPPRNEIQTQPIANQRTEATHERHHVHTERTTRVTATRVIREHTHEASPTNESEPTIHISIGRVEVRAVTPSAPKPATKPKPELMTIDDYVKRKERR